MPGAWWETVEEKPHTKSISREVEVGGMMVIVEGDSEEEFESELADAREFAEMCHNDYNEMMARYPAHKAVRELTNLVQAMDREGLTQ